MTQGQTRREYVEGLAAFIAPFYGISPDEVLAPSRAHAEARQLLMWKCRQQLWTCKEVGRLFGRDHSTVTNGERTIESRMLVNDELRMLADVLPDFEDEAPPIATTLLFDRLRALRDQADRLTATIDARLRAAEERSRSPLIARAS